MNDERRSEPTGGPPGPTAAPASHVQALAPAAAGPDYPAGAVLLRDLHCVGCGYNLRTQGVGARCPECGRFVKESLLVLPRAEVIAAAIHLASWALLIKLLLNCVELQVVGWIIMLVAAHRLYYRSDLACMEGLGPKVKWLWITLLIATIGGAVTLLASGVMMAGVLRGGLTSTMSFSTSSAPAGSGTGGPFTNLMVDGISGQVVVSKDAQGATLIEIRDDNGNVVSSTVVQAGQSATIQDATGQQVAVQQVTGGGVTLTPPGGTAIRVRPGVTSLMQMPGMARGLFVGLLDVLVQLTGFVGSFLYILVCRGLAVRAREARLAARFKTILWLAVAGSGGILVVPLALFAGASSGLVVILPVLVIGGIAMICLLVAAIWLIVASFALTAALRNCPREWSEIAGLPEAQTAG